MDLWIRERNRPAVGQDEAPHRTGAPVRGSAAIVPINRPVRRPFRTQCFDAMRQGADTAVCEHCRAVRVTAARLLLDRGTAPTEDDVAAIISGPALRCEMHGARPAENSAVMLFLGSQPRHANSPRF